MSKKDYKRGMEDALAANEGFSKKQEAAIEYVRGEAEAAAQKVDKLGDKIGEITGYITDQEKAALYKLNTPVDIADLDSNEKRVLLAVLYQLAADEEELTEEQQNYVRAVQQYLKIYNPQTEIDLEAVENIEDVTAQKAILQTVLEFFYLGTHPKSYTEAQMDFLDCFQVNRKTRKEISGHVETIINATGVQGLAEKYGYVPSEGTVGAAGGAFVPATEMEEIWDNVFINAKSQKVSVLNSTLDGFNHQCIETKDYYLVAPNLESTREFDDFSWAATAEILRADPPRLVNKRTKEMSPMRLSTGTAFLKYSVLEGIPNLVAAWGWADPKTNFTNNIFLLDLESGTYQSIASGCRMYLVAAASHYVAYCKAASLDPNNYYWFADLQGEVYIYDTITKKTLMLPELPGYRYTKETGAIINDCLYLMAVDKLQKKAMCKVSLRDGLKAEVFMSIHDDLPPICKVVLRNNKMLCYSAVFHNSYFDCYPVKDYRWGISLIDLDKKELKVLEIIKWSTDAGYAFGSYIDACQDWLLYWSRQRESIIAGINSRTGETVTFAKTHFNRFSCFGDCIYFGGCWNKIEKVSINHPGQLEILG